MIRSVSAVYHEFETESALQDQHSEYDVAGFPAYKVATGRAFV